nr:germ cell less protein 1 [Hymenolepis microstoma]
MGTIMPYAAFSRPLKRKANENLPDKSETQQYKRIRATYDYVYEQMFLKGENSDITIIALEREWHLHRIFLKHSQYFSALLEGGWKESEENVLRLKLTDENITEEGLHVIFGSFYNDQVKITKNNVVGVLAAATWFQLDEIRDYCERILCRFVKLNTISSLYDLSVKYLLLKLEHVCVSWLATRFSLVPWCKLSFEVKKKISISLMQSVIQHPCFIVLHFEQDLFRDLLMWVYLHLHPEIPYSWPPLNFKREVYAFFQHKNFFETPEGRPYADVFKLLKWENILTNLDSTMSVISDQLIPEAWINETCRFLWLKQLKCHDLHTLRNRTSTPRIHTISPNQPSEQDRSLQPVDSRSNHQPNSPPIAPTEVGDEFWKHCERFGTIIEHHRSWRWSGYAFGVDLVFSYQSNKITVTRSTEESEAVSLVSPLPTIKVEIDLRVFSRQALFKNDHPGDTVSDSLQEMLLECKDDLNADDSGDDDSIDRIKSRLQPTVLSTRRAILLMIPNAKYELLRLPRDIIYPLVISLAIRR